jgi:Na+-driven multidrug efflux pump
LGGGVAVLAGQNLGAKQPDRAVKSTKVGAAILTGFLLVCGAAILIWAESIVSIFDADPQLIAVGAAFLRIATAGYLIMGVNTALQNCIAGAGDTLPNALISFGMIWLVQIPLTYYLANHTSLGVNGIRWAQVISLFAGAIAFFLYFQSGRWKRKKV